MFLIVAGCIPFAVGGVLAVSSGTGEIPSFCPFRLATGLPCPLCGGTRAFTYAASGDTKFLTYNGFWVFVALAMIVTGLLLAFTRAPVRRLRQRLDQMPLVVMAVLLTIGWIWSLANQSTILG